MATQVQLRRGTSTQNDAFTGAQGELTYDTTNKRVRVHDGGTAGGFEIKTEDGSGNTIFADNEKAIFGAGSDLQIYHDASNSYIAEQGTGSLVVRGTNLNIQDTEGNNYAVMTDTGTGGTVTLYHNAVAKLNTNSTGIDVTGTVTADGLTVDSTSNDVIITGPAQTGVASSVVELKTGGTVGNRAGYAITNSNSASLIGMTGEVVGAGAYPSNTGKGYLWNADSGIVWKSFEFQKNLLQFYIASSEKMRIDASGNVGINTSSPASGYMLHVGGSSGVHTKVKIEATTATGQAELDLSADPAGVSYLNLGDEDSYNIGYLGYFHSDNSMRFQTNSAERMRIHSGGQLSLATTDATHGFNVGQSGTDFRGRFQGNNQYRLGLQNGTSNLVWLGSGGADNFRISNSAGSTRLEIDSNGLLKSTPTNDNITGSSANMVVFSDGQFARSTSSLRYKNTINDATHGLTELLTLRPVTYKGNNDGDTVFGGLIAEEVHDAGLTEFVTYNDDGQPDALAYGNMVSLCIKAIQELKTELDEAKARIKALETA